MITDKRDEQEHDGQWSYEQGSFDIYTDSMRIASNYYGMTIEFGLGGEGTALKHLLGRVRMSPQHAKIMSLVIADSVARYERETGINMPVPEEIAKRLEASRLAESHEAAHDTDPETNAEQRS